jgi:hypothetical protein
MATKTKDVSNVFLNSLQIMSKGGIYKKLITDFGKASFHKPTALARLAANDG